MPQQRPGTARMAASSSARKRLDPPRVAPPAPDTRATLRVRATALTFYGDRRRRPGDVFSVRPDQFNPRCMVRVDPTTPESLTGAQAALDDRFAALKAAGAVLDPAAADREEEAGADRDADNPLGEG